MLVSHKKSNKRSKAKADISAKVKRPMVTIDGNEAAASVAFRVNEVVAIYPITPSSAMGELCDEWASLKAKNIWGAVPLVQQMQSEAGVAGAVHGALQTGSLTTTFTCSQGLLLMIPNMYKIAGELTPTVFHIAARSLASHALSIFGDHSDVMAARATGFAFLSSTCVQEVMDFALIAQASTLESNIPFIHFFDGFRTSHELSKIEQLTDDDLRAMIDDNLVLQHRNRRLSPDNPFIRGTAQNPDVYFQGRETVNPFYENCPNIVQRQMDKLAKLTGRAYKLFDYYGAPDAERVIVIMGSGAEACQDTVDKLVKHGEKVGLVKVRLYRPFSRKALIAAIPATVETIAVMDRTKEPGSAGEPLYLDVVNAVYETAQEEKWPFVPTIIGGRYGLSSKEFTPAMIKRIYEELTKEKPKNHFTIGIQDDVSRTSLDYDESFIIESPSGVRAIFYGLGSDGTVSANKSSIKIIGENTPNYAQGYFVYDSKKSGSVTISHLRFGPKQIHSTYLVNRASFVACHAFGFMEKYDVLKELENGGVFLLNSPFPKNETWDQLPFEVQNQLIRKKIKFYAIDAYHVARKAGLGNRINTIMQTCFFAISGILPREEAIAAIKTEITHTYRKKGEEVIRLNFEAVDHALENLYQIELPAKATGHAKKPLAIPADAPDIIQEVTAKLICQQGESIPVSALPCDGTYPSGTASLEKRNVALEIPSWETDLCIQCGKCVAVCPHAAIRAKVYEPQKLEGAPSAFKSTPAKDREFANLNYTIQVAPEDCTGCKICVDVCPVKSKTDPNIKALNMLEAQKIKEQEKSNWEFFKNLPLIKRALVKKNSIRGIQCLEPLFEFSGACAGCGETPYIKLLSQLFGDRMLIANATGCSSIFGGNLPTTPWTKNNEGRGPAWSNSLFEDNAEFGFGFRLSIDNQIEFAKQILQGMVSQLGDTRVAEILNAQQNDETQIFEQRERVELLKQKLKAIDSAPARQLLSVADLLVKKSVWIIGGDGWAYDIGFGGLDHVLASGRNVNILVLDTEVYSNTGGQASKSTPRAAIAKFANAGKSTAKKDLARYAMMYANVYVANVALGAKDEHTLKAILEAEAYEGTSLIIAYAHCIAHGINMNQAMENQKLATMTGYWPLFRYNPQLKREGKNPLILDSSEPKTPLQEYINRQARFKILSKTSPEQEKFLALAKEDIEERWKFLENLSRSQTDTPNPDKT